MMVSGRVLYVFKKYKDDFDGRLFTCFDEVTITSFLKSLKHVKPLVIKTTKGIQDDNLWISLILEKND